MFIENIVKKVNSDKTVVVSCSTSACSSCKAALFCSNKKHNEFLALNINNLVINEGDIVELFLNPKKTILSLILLFLIPLVIFLISFLFLRNITGLSESVSGLISLILMGTCFIFTYLFNRKYKEKLMPVIVRNNMEYKNV